MNTQTLQQTNPAPVAPPPLPQIFSDVKRVKGGYKVFTDKWTFYATACLTPAQVSDLEDMLEEVKA